MKPLDWVHYRCGHEKWIALSRLKMSRKQKREWLSTQLCPQCHSQHQRDQRTMQALRDIEEAKRRGLAPLRGSEAMVTWALRIRAACLMEIDQRFEHCHNRPDATQELLQRGLSACLRAINRHTDACWWIDHLEELPEILTLDYLRELASNPPERGPEHSSAERACLIQNKEYP